jgi:hypothetical protein
VRSIIYWEFYHDIVYIANERCHRNVGKSVCTFRILYRYKLLLDSES